MWNAVMLAAAACAAIIVQAEPSVKGMFSLGLDIFSAFALIYALTLAFISDTERLDQSQALVYEKMADAMRAANGLKPQDRAMFGLKLLEDQQMPGATRVMLAETVSGGYHMAIMKLPVAPAKMRDIALALMTELEAHPGKPLKFSGVKWSGKGRPLTDPEFRILQDIMIRRGWLECNSKTLDPRQGYHFTRAGEAALRYIVKARPTLEPGPPQQF